MKDIDYVGLNVTIRAHETSLLSREHYDRMLGAASFEEAANVLRETPYRNDVDRIKENRDYDTMLTNELHETFKFLFRSTPNEALIELPALRFAYHNLKVLFKEEFTEQDFKHLYIPVGRYPIAELRKAVRTGKTAVLPNDYMDSIKEVREDINDYRNANSIDIILDRRYFTHLRNIAESLGDPDILDIVIKRIDYYNISTIVRAVKQNRTPNFLTTILSSSGSLAKKKLIERAGNGLGEVERFLRETEYRNIIENSIDSSGDLSSVKVDYETDNAFMRKMRDAKLHAFGPLPALAYIYAKEAEIKNVRLILAGKENSVKTETIEERMRLSYVS